MKLTINETAQELREDNDYLIDGETLENQKPRSRCRRFCDCLTIGKYRTPLPLSQQQHYYSTPCTTVLSFLVLGFFALFTALSFIEVFTNQSNWVYQVHTRPISYYNNNQTICDSYFGCEEMTVENLLDEIVSRREYFISMNAAFISFSRCEDDSFV